MPADFAQHECFKRLKSRQKKITLLGDGHLIPPCPNKVN